MRVTNADYDATVRIRRGDFIDVTLTPERGRRWDEPRTMPDGVLALQHYAWSSDGTLHATFQAVADGHAGIFSDYDCASGSCPGWSVSVNAG